MEREAVEEGFRYTPTWRAKCRISGSGRPLRFEHWGARGDFASYLPAPPASLGSELRKEQHKRHRVYTGSGHRCGVIPYSSVWWWIASWAEDEQYKGKNSLLRRGVLVLGGCEDDLNLSKMS